MFSPCVTFVCESFSCLQYEDGSQNRTVTAGKGSNMQEMLKNCLTAQEKQLPHEQFVPLEL